MSESEKFEVDQSAIPLPDKFFDIKMVLSTSLISTGVSIVCIGLKFLLELDKWDMSADKAAFIIPIGIMLTSIGWKIAENAFGININEEEKTP